MRDVCVYANVYKEKELERLGRGSVGRMLVLQASGLEFHPQNLCKIRPSAREAETGRCLGLIGQPAELCSEKRGALLFHPAQLEIHQK